MPFTAGAPPSGGRSHARRVQPSTPPVALDPAAEPSFRLRHLLLVGSGLLLAAWLWPRGEAAWQLHQLGVVVADHSLCMAGPTGPTLLREQPGDLPELLRRRVVAAEGAARPFVACAVLADQLDLSARARQAYEQPAREFLEYHGDSPNQAGYSVTEFALSTAPLAQLAERAWPFVRGGYLRLILPSSHAHEAPHPVRPPSPGRGHGLPTFRFGTRTTKVTGARAFGAFGSGANAQTLVSDDGGVTWKPGGRAEASEIIDRCVVDEEGSAFSVSRTDAGRHVVLSQGPGAAPQAALLSELGENLVARSCDGLALAAVLVRGSSALEGQSVRLRLCPFRRPCRDLLPPPGDGPLRYPIDLSRIAGDTVLAKSAGGITRVTSTRDDGRTWAPWTLAFDAVSAGLPASLAPQRLLTVGERVLLFGRPETRASGYPLLVSGDHGAAFQAPDSAPPAKR